VDGNIGGGIDGTGGADFGVITEQIAAAERVGFDGVWSTEVSRDPFLPLLVAAEKSSTLLLGTAAAVAFARNPMTMAAVANDLKSTTRSYPPSPSLASRKLLAPRSFDASVTSWIGLPSTRPTPSTKPPARPSSRGSSAG
jgi:hypothetical protein